MSFLAPVIGFALRNCMQPLAGTGRRLLSAVVREDVHRCSAGRATGMLDYYGNEKGAG
jgi:hypothetical protein